MAISRRDILADSTESYADGTSVPGGSSTSRETTQDFKQIHEQYAEAASAREEFETGALLPRDMTVKLVRADTANWETLLSILYSVMFTLFGLFLGAGLSKESPDEFSSFEWLATWAFAALAALFVSIWVYLKVRLQSQGLRVPLSVFESYALDSDTEPTSA